MKSPKLLRLSPSLGACPKRLAGDRVRVSSIGEVARAYRFRGESGNDETTIHETQKERNYV